LWRAGWIALSLVVLPAAGLSVGCRSVLPGEPGANSNGSSGGIPISCRPEGALPERGGNESDRTVACAVDVGSRNVKLIVASIAGSDPTTFRNERQCRARFQLADKTIDKATGNPRPLKTADQDALINLFGDYAARCKGDGGKMFGAVATEWARNAPNAPDIQRAVEKRAGFSLQILDRDEEARYGYLAATRGQRGKLVLDFGSRSLQLSFWGRSAAAPVVVGVAHGIDALGDRFFAGPAISSYSAGQTGLRQALRADLEPFFAKVREARGKGEIDGQLYSLGENGDLALALEGKLWTGDSPRAVSDAAYSAAVKSVQPTRDPQRGMVTAVFTPQQLAGPTSLYEQYQPLFEDLRSSRLKRVYGNKMLVFPALVALLEAELDLDEVVLVPQEMADGVLLERLGATAPTTARR
jgi:hypothetical protein